MIPSPDSPPSESTFVQTCKAYFVHIYTASGVVLSLLILLAILEKDYRMAYIWMIAATGIDATDGYLARHWEVKRHAPSIQGADIDNIVDYLNYTFLPLFLIGHAKLVPGPVWVWVSFAMLTSLFGFANADAKQAEEGFFLGFPSYWNIVAGYMHVATTPISPYLSLFFLLLLGTLTVAPLRFVYPTRIPYLRKTFLIGAVLWAVSLFAMFWFYPPGDSTHASQAPLWLIWSSFLYPVFYMSASVWLDFRARRRKAAQSAT